MSGPSSGALIAQLVLLGMTLVVAWLVIRSAVLSALRAHRREVQEASRHGGPRERPVETPRSEEPPQ